MRGALVMLFLACRVSRALISTASSTALTASRRGSIRWSSSEGDDDIWSRLGARADEKFASDLARGVKLFVVPTPLGEPSDATFRSVATLRRADVIACEDTRKMGLTLQSLGIAKRGLLRRHDAMTESSSSAKLVDLMRSGQVVALCSDAGTPCVSDPGSLLVRCAAEAGLKIASLSGACAATVALSASGFDTTQGFLFAGFLSGRGASAKRQREINDLADEKRPVVLYESPKRAAATLRALAGLKPERACLVARELTKSHEELWRGTTARAAEWIESGGGRESGRVLEDGEPRGEFTVVLDRQSEKPLRVEEGRPTSGKRAGELLAAYRAQGMPLSAASRAVAEELGLRKSDVYKLDNKKKEKKNDPEKKQGEDGGD